MSRLGKILLFGSFLSLLCFATMRFILGAWIPFLWLCLGFFLLLGLGALYVDRVFYREFFGMKTTRQGMSMGAMIALAFTALVAVNFVAARKYTTFDFSMNKVNTLSDQSVKLLKSLKGELRVLYFYKDGTEGVEQNRRAFIELIRKYQDQSDNVKLEFVEINKRPDLTEKYEVKKGTQAVLLEYNGKRNLIEKIDEQELTSALVKVTREKDKTVYLVMGHGELPLEQVSDGNSASLLKSLLEGNRYTVKTFSFTETPQVPSDADVVMVLGPMQGFLDVEVKALEAYLRRGGGLVLALEPKTKHGLDGLLKTVGIGLRENFIASVLETPVGRAIDPRFTRGSVFSAMSEITKPFGKSEFTLFRLPQALVKTAEPPSGMTVEDLVKTTDQSMAFTGNDFKAAGDKGPFTIAMEVKGAYPGAETAPAEGEDKVAKPKEFSLIVLGDRDIVNDQYLYQNLNRDLVLNAVAALAKEENLISITPKEVARTELKMTETQLSLFRVMALCVPAALFLVGGVLWFRRRYA